MAAGNSSLDIGQGAKGAILHASRITIAQGADAFGFSGLRIDQDRPGPHLFAGPRAITARGAAVVVNRDRLRIFLAVQGLMAIGIRGYRAGCDTGCIVALHAPVGDFNGRIERQNPDVRFVRVA